jgi:hypothetical protein
MIFYGPMENGKHFINIGNLWEKNGESKLKYKNNKMVKTLSKNFVGLY